jgi:hypothetical protein
MISLSHIYSARTGIGTFSRKHSGDEVFAREDVRRFEVDTTCGAGLSQALCDRFRGMRNRKAQMRRRERVEVCVLRLRPRMAGRLRSKKGSAA